MKCENDVTHMLGFPELFTTIIKTPNKGMLFWRHDVEESLRLTASTLKLLQQCAAAPQLLTYSLVVFIFHHFVQTLLQHTFLTASST